MKDACIYITLGDEPGHVDTCDSPAIKEWRIYPVCEAHYQECESDPQRATAGFMFALSLVHP